VTVLQAVDDARSRLQAAGVRDPYRDAELLLRHVLGWDQARLVVSGGEDLEEAARARFAELVEARASRRPLQHLTGVQAFWRHDFLVTPDVLVPRPETEHLVELGLEWLAGRGAAQVVDVGTGSGCIAISVAAEVRAARVSAVDLSQAALAVARANAARIGAGVSLLRGDLLGAFRPASLDLVLSNPPYVDAADVAGLDPEVGDHEPLLALVPPEGWRALYAQLGAQAREVLRAGGALAVEVGAGQAAEVAWLLEEQGLVPRRTVADLAGIPRVVLATKP
jgi:release factor glutamine methyltransferase